MDTRFINSSLFNRPPWSDRRFEVILIHESYLYENPLPRQFLTTGIKKYGISGAYTCCDTPNLLDESACLLSKVAIATPECVLIVTLDFEASPGQYVNHNCLYDNFFSADGDPCMFIGFNLDRLSLQLYAEYGLFIRHGVDPLALSLDGISSARSVKAFTKTYKEDVSANGLAKLLFSEEDTDEGDLELATRAWAGAVMDQVSEPLATAIGAAAPINVCNLEESERVELHRVMLSSDRLRLSAEEFQKHEIKVIRKGSKFYAVSQQFNTRVRGTDFEFEITFENEIVNAKIKSVRGTKAELELTAPIDLEEAGKVESALTLGRPEPTSLEHQKHNIVLFALQGKISLLQNSLLAQIWFPDRVEALVSSAETPKLFGEQVKKLNESQTAAVVEMLKKDQQPRIVLIHGPPGTGKTSVICAATESMLLGGVEEDHADQKPEDSTANARYEHEDHEEVEEIAPQGPIVWIIAQSNVAVKNVAEKLIKIGLFQFKLLVSEDFHFEWHEDLYARMPNMSTTKDLPKNSSEVKAWIGSAQIILSTLSMITSPVLMKLSFHDFAAVHNVVIDEASQIQIGDLLPLIHWFGSGIERICLVGDHKQLAPYGQEQIRGLQSIFEMEHIVDRAVMLSETYRLPQPICDIISQHMYNNKLDSQHKETRNSCCKWIDIADGEEEEDSHSFINRKEVEAVILLAKELIERKKEFRIISPYATQTNLIMKILKEAKMPWENMCFNVDSFQGNEADFIIVSLVRTKTIGFLDNDRRANVLLTRCRKGMFVVCNRNLIVSEKGRNTLLGKFALAWTGNQQWSKAGYKWPTFQDLEEDKIHLMVDQDLPSEAPKVSLESAADPLSSSKDKRPKQEKRRKKRSQKNK